MKLLIALYTLTFHEESPKRSSLQSEAVTCRATLKMRNLKVHPLLPPTTIQLVRINFFPSLTNTVSSVSKILPLLRTGSCFTLETRILQRRDDLNHNPNLTLLYPHILRNTPLSTANALRIPPYRPLHHPTDYPPPLSQKTRKHPVRAICTPGVDPSTYNKRISTPIPTHLT